MTDTKALRALADEFDEDADWEWERRAQKTLRESADTIDALRAEVKRLTHRAETAERAIADARRQLQHPHPDDFDNEAAVLAILNRASQPAPTEGDAS